MNASRHLKIERDIMFCYKRTNSENDPDLKEFDYSWPWLQEIRPPVNFNIQSVEVATNQCAFCD